MGNILDKIEEILVDKVLGAWLNKREFIDFAILLLFIGFFIFISFMSLSPLSTRLYKYSSYIWFILILIVSFYIGTKNMKADMELMCANKDESAPSDAEPPKRGFFRLEYDNHVSTTLTFVYYYILTFVRTMVMLIVFFAIVYIIYIIVNVQWDEYTSASDLGFWEFLRWDKLQTNPIVYSLCQVNLGVFGGRLLWMLLVLPCRLLVWLGDKIWWKLGLEKLVWFFEPVRFLSFFDFKNSKDIATHVYIFVIGLILALLYGGFFVAPLSKNKDEACEDKAWKEDMAYKFVHGYFVVCSVVIAMYVFDFGSTIWNNTLTDTKRNLGIY